jgi:hypothetical protein
MPEIKGWCFGILGLGSCAIACGDDDAQRVVVVVEGAGGEAAEPFPPALGPEDCVTAVTELEVSQPIGADVWGGITLLEFQVEGANLRSFEAQAFDSDAGVWTNQYLPTTFSGQREDGTYVLGVSISPSEANQDADQWLRVRPVQDGCPPAEWVESDTFTLGSPVLGVSWHGSLPIEQFNSSLVVDPSAYLSMSVSAAELDVTFGDDGAFSETLALTFSTEEAGPFDACTIAFTFEGSWRHEPANYSGGMVYLSPLVLSGIDGSDCKGGPAPASLRVSDPEEAAQFKLAPAVYYLNVDYLPTLSSTPGAPIWRTSFGRDILYQLPQLLAYEQPSQGAGGAPAYDQVMGQLDYFGDHELEKQ